MPTASGSLLVGAPRQTRLPTWPAMAWMLCPAPSTLSLWRDLAGRPTPARSPGRTFGYPGGGSLWRAQESPSASRSVTPASLAPQLALAMSRIARRTGRALHSVTTDGGYGEPPTERELQALGVPRSPSRRAKVASARRSVERNSKDQPRSTCHFARSTRCLHRCGHRDSYAAAIRSDTAKLVLFYSASG
jgi:hypothetical protein